jgi:hypothetical protein
MDFKKFVADLAARYRKPTEPTPAAVVDVDAAHEAGRKGDMKLAMPKGTMSAGKPDTRAAKLKGTRPATIRATTRAFK